MILTAEMPEKFPESVLTLGDDRNLIAITTEPAQSIATKPTVVMLNAGVLHRVGPHRLHVLLARSLAALGFVTCRIDLSGIGDSRVITRHASFRDSAVADTRALMDHLARTANGRERFVIFGLCSGADNALATAASDPRIVGLVLIDPPAYPTFRSYMRKFAQRAARSNPFAFAGTVTGAVVRSAARRFQRNRGSGPAAGRQPPPPKDYHRQLDSLLKRGARVLSIYTGALHERYNHADQLFEVFPRLRGRVDVEYFGDADHIFTESREQKRLIETVAGWLARTYP